MNFTDGSVAFTKPDPATYNAITANAGMSMYADINVKYLPVLENNAK